MVSQIVLLSGPIGSGKSTLADGLGDAIGNALVLSSRLVLARMALPGSGREDQRLKGDELDSSTKGSWLAGEALKLLRTTPDAATLVIDAVRTAEQVAAFRASFAVGVCHIHLFASPEILTERFEARQPSRIGESASLEIARNSSTEAAAERLGSIANLILDTSELTEEQVLSAALAYLTDENGRAASRPT